MYHHECIGTNENRIRIYTDATGSHIVNYPNLSYIKFCPYCGISLLKEAKMFVK